MIVGAPDELDMLVEGYEEAAANQGCLDFATQLDIDGWLTRRAAEDPEYYEEPRGDWPDDIGPTSAFSGHTNVLTGEPLDQVAIVLVPSSNSWQVPCLLGYGDWNECPAPAEHSAILKRWQERFDATLVRMTHDVIELAVGRPVRTRDEALALAKEQYVYGPDIVQQGTETIEGLAAALLGAPVWYFWWD